MKKHLYALLALVFKIKKKILCSNLLFLNIHVPTNNPTNNLDSF